MIRIINNKKSVEILIDDQHNAVIFTSKDYEDDYPSVSIDLKHIDFTRHALKCPDCKQFVDDFGTSSLDWFLIFNQKKYRLDLSSFGTSRKTNLASWQVSEYFTGTKLKFLISNVTIESLQYELISSLENEDYERCAFIRDRMHALIEENKNV